ncbi:3'-phosphoesterase [Candidatus Falkowbacteria bacterium]|nr:3'-phosphoesterase [Candidatus Falkowbacteria bacterium]
MSLIYVVHKHRSRQLHYDLRLERKGVLMSWAVPKQPSNSGLKRLAMRVENHALDYAKFEGEIPEGQYGAGIVEIWDKGTWLPESVKKDKIVFELHGKKLSGRFALIKLANSEKSWLFFKLKD